MYLHKQMYKNYPQRVDNLGEFHISVYVAKFNECFGWWPLTALRLEIFKLHTHTHTLKQQRHIR